MRKLFPTAFIVFAFASCSVTKNGTAKKGDGKISINLIQINDVYEIAPLSNGKEGGMARVATLKKKYLQKNPNTYLIIAGDFVSPSVYNSLQYKGKAIRGRQMIEALNTAGTDIAIFGNHEFDIKENELESRINESDFRWIATNSFHKVKDKTLAFTQKNIPLPKTWIMKISDVQGTAVKIGFMGITIPFNKAEYVSYADPLSSAKQAYNELKDSVDAVIAITHQSIRDDEKLAREIPGLTMIIGGHEHDQHFEKIGNIYITKALANARSAFVIRLEINKKKHKTKVEPTLEMLNEKVALDSATNTVVQKWNGIAEKNYSSLGFDARKIIMNNSDPLDGRETAVRSGSTNLTKLIVAAMKNAVPNADLVLLNSGSIRVDDVLQMPVTEYDILRTLPFGGSIREADMKGRLVIKILQQGKKNTGIGGFLQYNEQVRNDAGGNWFLNEKPIDATATYHVAVSDFLFTGMEANLDFLNPHNPDVVKTYDPPGSLSDSRSDIRLAVVRYLEKK